MTRQEITKQMESIFNDIDSYARQRASNKKTINQAAKVGICLIDTMRKNEAISRTIRILEIRVEKLKNLL